MIFYLIIIPFACILIKLILNLVVGKFGKITYDGFSAAGFAYHTEKDIFYSTKNAWQKNFGYAHIYDVFAPIFQMIIDTEPIRFNYNNKNWLITFWKGQYGIVTGAEIGIYCTSQQKVNKKTIYLPIEDNEMLDMKLVLYKKGKEITRVHTKHWWLAIFKLGMFSKPKDLTMDIEITFLDQQMLEAFLNAFKKLGYKSKDYKVINNTFCFTYKKPRTRKVWTRIWFVDAIRQSFNRRNVKLYNKLLNDLIDDNKIDDTNTNNKLIRVNNFLPNLLKNAPEDLKSAKDIVKKIYNEKDNNVVILNSDVYSTARVNNDD